jgi:hypothetical protein
VKKIVRKEPVALVMSCDELRAVDDWRRMQPDWPNRSEAVRRLVAAGLVVLAVRNPLSLPDAAEQGLRQ